MKGKDVDYFDGPVRCGQGDQCLPGTVEVLEKIVQCVVKAMGVKASSIRLLDSAGADAGARRGMRSFQGYIRKGPILSRRAASTERC